MDTKITSIKIVRREKDVEIVVDFMLNGKLDKFKSRSIEFQLGMNMEEIILHNIKLCVNAIIQKMNQEKE